MPLKYFTAKELQCPQSGIVKLAPGFDVKLDELREAYGAPLHVNSCCRSTAHNANVGGADNSFHIYDRQGRGVQGTCAIDIRMTDGKSRWRLANIAMELGWSVGVAKGFLHLDRRTDYPESGWPEPVMFTY